jgi:hypothetical protein
MIKYPESTQLLLALAEAPPGSLDFVVLITGVDWAPAEAERWIPYLDAAARALREGGLLFVQGVPETLPELGVYLDRRLRFKYWIAIESALRASTTGVTPVAQEGTQRIIYRNQGNSGRGLPSTHAALLMFAKGEAFRISRVRFPHQVCRACGRPLRDWGGKTHLMHPDGVAISDVWKGLSSESVGAQRRCAPTLRFRPPFWRLCCGWSLPTVTRRMRAH